MKPLSTIIALLLGISLCHAGAQKLQMSLDDEYTVQDTEKWTVSVQRYMPLRLAEVEVSPKQQESFSLMLYFKCDTKDLAQYDTPEKMRKSVTASSKKYLGFTVEKEIKVEEIHNKGWYGFKTKLTDAKLAAKKSIPTGEFLYIYSFAQEKKAEPASAANQP